MSDSKHFRNVYVVCDFWERIRSCYSSMPKALKAVSLLNEKELDFYNSLSSDLQLAYTPRKFQIKRLTVL